MKINKVFLLIIILGISTIIFPQSFSYFPLTVGSKWYFSYGYDGIRNKLEIQKDTVMADGFSYAKFNMYKVNSDLTFELTDEGYSYLRLDNRKIIEYPNRIIFDFDINIGDSVISFYNEPYPAVLDNIIDKYIFGRKLSTYTFTTTGLDFYSYSDSIGFYTLHETTFNNWLPGYLLGCEINGKTYGSVITNIKDGKINTNNFILFQNYPNPFNPTTKIKFGVPKESKVTLTVYNILGEKVTELVNQQLKAGYHEVEFNNINYTSGIYLYSLKTGNYIATKKMILLK